MSNDTSTEADGGSTAVGRRARRVPLWAVIAAALAVAAILAVALWPKGNDRPSPEPAPVIPAGSFIEVPDNRDSGVANDKYVKNIGKTDSGKSPEGFTYEDPTNMDDYRVVDANGRATMRIPLDGECKVLDNGAIGAPSNYRHACYYKSGVSVAYTSHAVRGPRVGALENIRFLKVGQTVNLNGETYKVERVEVHPAVALPPYLFHPTDGVGRVMLVTCHLDDRVESGEPFTKTDVVTLVKA